MNNWFIRWRSVGCFLGSEVDEFPLSSVATAVTFPSGIGLVGTMYACPLSFVLELQVVLLYLSLNSILVKDLL